MTWRRFLKIAIPLWLSVGMLAIVLKFSTFLDHFVMFPAIPDVFDLLFLALAAVYIMYQAAKPLWEYDY
jgi:hypothetical protein